MFSRRVCVYVYNFIINTNLVTPKIYTYYWWDFLSSHSHFYSCEKLGFQGLHAHPLKKFRYILTPPKTLTANFEVLQYQTCSQFKNTSKSTFSYFKIKIYLRQKNPLFLYLFEWEILFILLILLLLLCTNEQIRIC